jgi:ParB family chromosome partitioning protein
VNKRKLALATSISAVLGAAPVPVAVPTETQKGQSPATPPRTPAAEPEANAGLNIEHVPVDRIRANPRQPRHRFNETKLQELAESIRRHGVLQPLVARREKDMGWTLLAGERRLRAARLAGLVEVPVIPMDADEEQLLELSIVENVQRDDLNAVEEARAYRQLMTSFSWTQEQIADRVGKSRPSVANALRLLALSDAALLDLEEGRLTAGHARALLMVDHPIERERLRRDIISGGLSVREAERRAQLAGRQRAASPKAGGRGKAPEPKRDLDIARLEERLVERLGCPVRVRPKSATAGSIELQYQNLDDLDRLLELLAIEE